MQGNIADVKNDIKEGLTAYTDWRNMKNTEKYPAVNSTALLNWKSAVMQDITEHLQKTTKQQHILDTSSDNTWKKELRKLHQHLVICPTDKTTQNLTLMCKWKYEDELSRWLDSDLFEKVPLTQTETILQAHNTTRARLDITTEDPNTFPYAYFTFKAHKKKLRPIAGCTTLEPKSSGPEALDLTLPLIDPALGHGTETLQEDDYGDISDVPEKVNISRTEGKEVTLKISTKKGTSLIDIN